MSVATAVASVLALVSTTLTNLACLQYDAAAELPVLWMRRPLQPTRILLADPGWMLGFAMETVGFLLYVLAYASARLSHGRLSRGELTGVLVSVLGLVGAIAST